MITIQGFNFDPKLTPLTSLKIRRLAQKMGFDYKELIGLEWDLFLDAVLCDNPVGFLELDLFESKKVREELHEHIDYKKMEDQLKPDKVEPEKKKVSKTHK